MRTTAAVLGEVGRPRPYAGSRPLELVELELDAPGPGEILVEIRAAGLCHSDLSVIDGARPRPVPMALGHEAAGVVAALGPGVDGLAEGDHVVLSFVPSCGDCGPCAGARPWLCEPGAAANGAGTLLSGERRLAYADGRGAVHHHLGVSGFAERAVVSARSAVRVDPELPFDIAALFGCAVLTGVGAALHAADVQPGETVAVLGLGGVGLAAVLGARLAGAGRIVVADPVEHRRTAALELGADEAISAGPDAVAALRAAAGGGGADKVIETAGRAAVLAEAYAATARGGTTVTVGLPPPSEQLAIAAVSLVAEERTLRGSYLGSCDPARDVPRFVGLYQEGRLPVDRLLTHRLGLDELNEGFDRLAAGEGIRQVVLL